ncbi:FAD/FMN-containing dehydrogenase/Fe-S oxidoreductase [Kutzneria kofuensis]|uniref:FAD/FMN-containing dehydrogenase/Fe-S oxidoreductase n=3 Tax=Kutzneria kofuensis TaxID=103725 RepID=A0A7W9KMN6_9PSEU|nr:FAD-binding and (Fe-S)-binding domain-containing protein [Kutzneria kofuensis]MBB5895367.1 FAD/FMN-containing dehydrogenase/Fe-S oxidoreductase [Kutzneria kofuensis]
MTSRLVERLRTEVDGDVLADPGTRAMYAADASNYRHVPLVVVRPRTVDAAVAAVGVAAELGVPITSRGAGTSIAGNACGEGLVLDFSRHLNQVLDVDPVARTAVVQPGVVPDVLNGTAGRHGLHFAPDPSTHSRCTIGGMIGNNACGAHSVAWGKTVDNVESLDVLLPDGSRFEAGPVADDVLPLHGRLRALRDEVMAAVRTGFPRIPRRVSGYNLDQLLPENGFHVGRALVGSEGTCVTVLGATVKLVEIPRFRALVVLGFEDTYAAADQVVALLSLDVLAIEGVNEDIVSILRQRKPGTPGLKALPAGRSWLFVETVDPDAVVAAMPGATGSVVVTDPARMRELWRIREDGAGLATRMPDGAEAWSGWEDAAVPPGRLGAYLRDFDRLLGRHGRRGPTYGHYGDGCLHVRIDFDLHGPGYRAFMEEAADLVVSHGGSLSGEHGDGQARSELLPRMYSPEIMAAFGRFKAIFDPRGLMNPGRIVDPLPLDADLRVVIAPARIPVRTSLALHADHGDLAAASRRCVGVGKCLTASGGVMCPSYRATREEKHSTRGRARLLFDMLNGSVVRGGWRSAEVREALDLCLSCKGCKRDCPVDVDMATYKAEFLHQHYRRRLRPMSHYSMGFLPLWLALAPGLVRALGDVRVVKRLGGIDPRRSMPIVHDRSFRSRFEDRARSTTGDPVILFPDTFTDHFDPQVGMDAVTVLEHLGFQVSLPRKRVCCGLTWMSTGQLGTARRVLHRTARIMDGSDTPVVGLEPSCTAFLKSDALELTDDPAVRRLAGRVRTFAEQVAPAMKPLGDARAVMQPHCHQYAELGLDADREVLRTAGVDATVLDAGCCGLAGNFGFEAGHYDVSVAVAEHVLLPAVRATDATVLADGFSCRTQLRQLTDRDPVHLATLLAGLIDS